MSGHRARRPGRQPVRQNHRTAQAEQAGQPQCGGGLAVVRRLSGVLSIHGYVLAGSCLRAQPKPAGTRAQPRQIRRRRTATCSAKAVQQRRSINGYWQASDRGGQAARCCRSLGRDADVRRSVRVATKAVGQPAPSMPGPEAQAFARHKESSGLIVSGLSPPMPASGPTSPPLLTGSGHPTPLAAGTFSACVGFKTQRAQQVD